MSRYSRDNNRGRKRVGRESGYFRSRRDPERDESTGEIIRNRDSSSDGGDRSSSGGGDRSSSYGRDRSSSYGRGRSSSYGRDRSSSGGGDRSSSYGRDRSSSYGRDRSSSDGRGRSSSYGRDRSSSNSDRREFDQTNNKTDLDIRLSADNTKQLEKICKENNWNITEGINNAIELLTLSDPNSKKKTSLGSAIRTQFIKHIIKDMVNTIEDKLTSDKQITEQEKNYPEFEKLGQEITDKLFKSDTDKKKTSKDEDITIDEKHMSRLRENLGESKEETSKDDKEETSKDDKVLTKKVSRKKVEKKEPVDVKKVKKEDKWIGPKMPRKAVTRKTL